MKQTLALLLLLLAACRPKPVPVPTDDVEDDTPAIPSHPTGPTATVLFLDSAGRAVPLACAAPGVGMYLDPGDCVELLGDDRTIGDLGQGRRQLGDPADWFCGSNHTTRHAFRIDAPPGQAFGDGDPANDLIVWPAERGFDVAVWKREDDPQPADASLGVAGANLLGTLRLDVDGDDQVDTVYSVGAAGGPHKILGVLSGSGDDVVTLMTDSDAELQAYAAIDLDGDGRQEIVVAAPYDEGDWTAVEHYDPPSGQLAAVTGIGCGPS